MVSTDCFIVTDHFRARIESLQFRRKHENYSSMIIHTRGGERMKPTCLKRFQFSVSEQQIYRKRTSVLTWINSKYRQKLLESLAKKADVKGIAKKTSVHVQQERVANIPSAKRKNETIAESLSASLYLSFYHTLTYTSMSKYATQRKMETDFSHQQMLRD